MLIIEDDGLYPMSKTGSPIPAPSATAEENDTQYEVVPRRRADRRKQKKSVDSHREDERRQQDRRTSRPTLLSVDEIVMLRKR
jgi:hypothetical protein